MKNVTFFQEKESQVIFTGAYMEVYIPKFFFDKGVAQLYGTKVDTLGLFNFKVFSKEDNKEKADLRTFKLPANFVTCPSSITNQEININPDSDDHNYTVLKYFKGDIFIDNTYITRKSDSTISFVNLLHSGKLPSSIPYDEVIKLELENISINKVNFNVPGTILELIISEIYRDKNDLSKAYRYTAGLKANANMTDYKTINIKSIANFNSTFTAITFEDINFALASSINKFRSSKKEAVSPIEKTIKY